jgi:Methylase of chemotaxis methyl-accepting proteins
VIVAHADEAAVLARIERILYDKIGLDVTTVGSSLVERAVQRRMAASGERTAREYCARILADVQEMQELVEVVVIPETYFFREPEALEALAQRLATGASRPTAERPVRILSSPCSTGEEPYSIAMTLLAAGHSAAALAIDAVDVSQDAVRRARRAVYRRPSFRGGSFDWRPYFEARGEELALKPEVRDIVRITQANLFAPDFRAPRERYDAIFCRNLLIYFDTEAQARVIATLAALLAADGVLVVGAADTFAVRRAGFVPVAGAERAFLFRLAPEGERLPDVTSPVPSAPSKIISVKPAARRPARAARAVRPTSPRKRAAPAESAAPEDARAAVARLANEGRLAEAIRVGEAAMAGGTPSAELLMLVGDGIRGDERGSARRNGVPSRAVPRPGA